MLNKNSQIVVEHVCAAWVESLEQRAYLSVAFDNGRTAPYAPGFNSAVVDFTVARFNNNDANLDLGTIFVSASSTSAKQADISLGNGAGAFTKAGVSIVGTGIQARSGDFDGDGKADLFVRNNSQQVFVVRGDGTGRFVDELAPSRYIQGISDFTTADMNNDGKTDLVAVTTSGVFIFRSNGVDGFNNDYSNPVTGLRPTVQAIDVDNNGRRDIIFGVANGTTGNDLGVILQNTDGTFLAVKKSYLGAYPIQIRAGYFNTDSILDLAVLGMNPSFYNTGSVDMLMGLGNGTFSHAETQALNVDAKGIAVGDFDLDGRSDVAVSVNYRDHISPTSFYVLRTSLDGTVVPYGGTGITAAADLIQSGDFNNDGKTDIVLREVGTKILKLYLSMGVKQNSIQGTLWLDSNENGVRESSESGRSGETIYVDSDDDGIPHPSELFTTTLAGGRWELQVPNGTYRIRLQPDSGWVQTSPYTTPTVTKTVPLIVAVSGAQTKTGNNFGTADHGDIQGAVFNDSNANQFFDPTESGLTGVGVYIDTNNNGSAETGEPIAFTDAGGRYKFNVGTYKSYVLRLLPVAGYMATTPTSRTVSAGPSSSALETNFGQTKPATISGHVYYDYSQNKYRDTEDVGVGGLKIFIDLDNDGVLDTGEPSTTTSASTTASLTGGYSFTGLVPRTLPSFYSVRVIKPTGYAQTTPATSSGQFITSAYGGFDTTYTNFGVIRPVYISGRTFRDSNANGTIDSTENGLSDITVFIDYNGNGLPDMTDPQVLTDSTGNYTLASARQGTFNVRAILRSGLNSTVPSSSVYAVNFVYGAATTTGRNFGMAEGAFTTAPYLSPVNFATGANPTALATGDFNADGKADFIVASNSSISRVYLGQGNGLFTGGQELSIGDSTRYMIATDVSGDGKPDLIAANDAFDFSATVLINNGNGTFQNAVGYAVTSNTYGVAAADFNGDGKKDLAYVGTSDGRIAILTNKGTGAFNPATFITNSAGGGKSISTGDLNGDGRADLVVANPLSNAVSVFLGNGNATFTKTAANVTGGITQPSFVALADLNNDGRLDLVTLNEFSDDVRVKLGNGNGTFATGQSFATGSTPTQVAVLDIDRDGKLDLIVSCRSDGGTDISGGISILRGRGDGTFVAQQVRTAHTSPTAVAVADYDRDGKLDIVAANFFSDDVSFLHNGTPAAPSTIKGTIWTDTDLDGTLDTGEAGIAGVRIFADVNANGLYDLGERTTTSTSNGAYALVNLPAGNFALRAEVPAAFVQTSLSNGAAQVVTLATGQTVTGRNFGLTPTSVAGTFIFDNRGAILTGSWNRVTATGQYGSDFLTDSNTSKGSKSARFDIKLPSGGYYQVAVRSVPGSDRAGNTPIDVKSASNTRTLTIDQRTGTDWRDLGTYYFNTTGGSVTIRNGGTNALVLADGVRLVPVAAPATVVKDNAATTGIKITGTWNTATTPSGFNGSNYLDDGKPTTKGGRSVAFTPSLPTSGVYELFARWIAGTDRASNVPLDIITATGTTTVTMDQRSRGGVWVSLGYYTFNPATAKVTIRNDGVNGRVIADAFQFVKV